MEEKKNVDKIGKDMMNRESKKSWDFRGRRLYHAKNGKFRRTLCTHLGGVTNDKKLRFPEF